MATQATTAGYSGTPLWKKLGYKPGVTAWSVGAPKNYRTLLALPKDVPVTWADKAIAGMVFVHLFTTKRLELSKALVSCRKTMAADGVLWISWPKKASGLPSEVTEDTVRELALPLGWVDVKVCAVDQTWSGLKLVIRKSER